MKFRNRAKARIHQQQINPLPCLCLLPLCGTTPQTRLFPIIDPRPLSRGERFTVAWTPPLAASLYQHEATHFLVSTLISDHIFIISRMVQLSKSLGEFVAAFLSVNPLHYYWIKHWSLCQWEVSMCGNQFFCWSPCRMSKITPDHNWDKLRENQWRVWAIYMMAWTNNSPLQSFQMIEDCFQLWSEKSVFEICIQKKTCEKKWCLF